MRGGLLDNADGYVSVEIGNSGIEIHEETKFTIGHKALIDGEYLLRSTSFVIEDIDADGGMYKQILNEAKKVSQIPSFIFDPIHGGGSATSRVFDGEIEKKRIVVCIVDHDKSAPMDGVSHTAKRVLVNHVKRNVEGRDETCRYIGLAMTTIGREVENVIPYRLFRVMEAYQDYRDYDKLDEIVLGEKIEDDDDCFWQYFDIKEGICGEKIATMVDVGGTSEECARWICGKLGCTIDQVRRIRIFGFGQNVVRNFLGSPAALSGFHAFTRANDWGSKFGDYFAMLLWFFAAPVRSRT